MEFVLLASVLLRLCAFAVFLWLFVRHRRTGLGLITLGLGGMTAVSGVLWVRRFVDPGFLGSVRELPLLVDVTSVLVSVAAVSAAGLMTWLFANNGRLLVRAREDARRQEMLLRELDHRVRNNLAALLTLIDLSAGEDPGSLTAERLRRRIHAISECHALLARAEGEPSAMGLLVEMLCAANPDVPAIAAGEDAALPRRMVQPLGMILQELFSNARKHGGTGRALGPVRVEWRLEGREAERVFELEWSEPMAAGRSVGIVAGSGLGLVRGLAEFEMGGEFRTVCSSGGLLHALRIPMPAEEGDRNGGGEAGRQKGRRLWARWVA